ncbi:MAG: molybdopterin oxidoreductase [Denitrovibrio sp.]|nr:MAG: molybdopterin oxidoreductase [Denitrovibrio sp.]
MIRTRLSRRRFLQAASAGACIMGLPVLKVSANSDKESAKSGVSYSQNWCEMCFWKCGLTAKTVNGRVQKLEGQAKCPSNYGKLCAKGNSGVFQLYDSDRVKYPMIRTGKRGEGKFRKATWEEAIQYIAEKSVAIRDQYGPESFSLFAHGSGEHSFMNLIEIIGSPNIAIPAFSQCTGSREIAWAATYGKPVGGKEPVDSDNSKCMMMLGRNIAEALHVGEVQDFVSGLSKGAELIYVDVRFSKTAAKANQFMMIRPGTDTALLLGMINYVISNNLYDSEFVKKYTKGFDELAEHVKKNSLEYTEKETGIPAYMIVNACKSLAKAAPSCYIHPGRRLSRYGTDVQFVRAIAVLNALFGNWDMPGGFYTPVKYPVKKPHMVSIDHHPTHDRADGAGTTFPMAPKNLGLANKQLEAIANQDPHPMKALFSYGTNLFHHQADSALVEKAIAESELVVTCDIYMTDTAYYSDVVLPESTYLERYDPAIVTSRKEGYIQYREPAVDPVHDTKGGWEIAELISKAMGYTNHFTAIEDFNYVLFKEAGTTEEYMKKHGCIVKAVGEPFPRAVGERPRFFTPSGKVELKSSNIEALGYSALPEYTPVPRPSDNEFRFLFGRISYHTHARSQNNAWLLALHDYEVPLWINTERAKKLGIKNGDKVRVTNGNNTSGELVAKVVDYIHPEAVFTPQGFGHESTMMTRMSGKGARTSDFCSNETDPISGGAGLQNGFVKIEKV